METNDFRKYFKIEKSGVVAARGNRIREDNITDIYVPSSMVNDDGIIIEISSLANGCFQNCNTVKHIEISDEITTWGRNCFYGCGSLETINDPYIVRIPETLESLGKDSFVGCNSIREILFPDTISYQYGSDELSGIIVNVLSTDELCVEVKSISVKDNLIHISDYVQGQNISYEIDIPLPKFEVPTVTRRQEIKLINTVRSYQKYESEYNYSYSNHQYDDYQEYDKPLRKIKKKRKKLNWFQKIMRKILLGK